MGEKKKKIVIGASLKFRDIIKKTIEELSNLGFDPLFPNINISSENHDVASSLDEKARLAWDHYKAIEDADAVYFILPSGYMGTSCKIELGYALALRKQIYFSELTKDFGLDCYPKKIISLESLSEFKKELH